MTSIAGNATLFFTPSAIEPGLPTQTFDLYPVEGSAPDTSGIFAGARVAFVTHDPNLRGFGLSKLIAVTLAVTAVSRPAKAGTPDPQAPICTITAYSCTPSMSDSTVVVSNVRGYRGEPIEP